MGFGILLCLIPTVLAVDVVLLDTELEQDELNWLVTPANGWEETVAVDKNFNTMRTYRVCNVEGPNQDNWLRSAYIARGEAQMVYVTLRFTVRDCTSIVSVGGSCRETFALYYLEVDSEGALEASTAAGMKATYTKARDISGQHVFALSGRGQVNRAIVPVGPLGKAGFRLGFRDRGACVNLLSVRVSYKRCLATVANLASFPATPAGPGLTSLAIAPGACIANAQEVSVPLKMHCTSEGDWVVPTGSCKCRAGYQSNEELTECAAIGDPLTQVASERGPSQEALGPSSCSRLEGQLRANQQLLQEQAKVLARLTQMVDALNATLLRTLPRDHLPPSLSPPTDGTVAPGTNGGGEN